LLEEKFHGEVWFRLVKQRARVAALPAREYRAAGGCAQFDRRSSHARFRAAAAPAAPSPSGNSDLYWFGTARFGCTSIFAMTAGFSMPAPMIGLLLARLRK